MSAKADFGTDLAISTRSELDPGDSIRTLCTNLFVQELVFDKFNFFAFNISVQNSC